MKQENDGEYVTYADHARELLVDAYTAAYANALAAAAPRTLTAADPEPAAWSVVLDARGESWQRIGNIWVTWGRASLFWTEFDGPVTLIHDGEDR